MSAVTTLLFARHGEIQANVDQRWHGSTDSDLTEQGRRQASLLADYLLREPISVDAIYTSPLRRTRQTAAPVGSAIGQTPVPLANLREFGIGVLENTKYTELLEKDQFYSRIEKDNHYAPPGGESVVAVGERMVAAVEQITRNHAGQTILLVSHGAAIAILLSRLMDGRYFPFHDYHSSNTGLTQLFCGERYELGFFDRTLHLESAIGETIMASDPLE